MGLISDYLTKGKVSSEVGAYQWAKHNARRGHLSIFGKKAASASLRDSRRHRGAFKISKIFK